MTNHRISWVFPIVIATLIRPLAAQEPPTPQQLIDAAHRVSDLTHLRPYTLSANVTVDSGDKKTIKTGHLTITRDRGRTREELEIGGLREVRIFAGGKTYVVPPNGLLDGMGLMDLDRKWDPVTFVVSKFHDVRRDKVQDADAWCMSWGSGGTESQSCFDVVKGAYLGHFPGDRMSNQYFDFATVGDQRLYPRRALISRGNLRIEVSSIEIKPGANEDLFALPDNAIEIEKCRGPGYLKRVYAPQLDFPEKERKQKIQGVVTLSVLVDKEGNVASAQALTSPTEGFAHEAEAEVRKWRFLPTTCGQPAYREAVVELDFHLY
jgi:TonB family protein